MTLWEIDESADGLYDVRRDGRWWGQPFPSLVEALYDIGSYAARDDEVVLVDLTGYREDLSLP